MHFIEEWSARNGSWPRCACIRQNVCTSLRTARFATRSQKLLTCIRQNVCTSLRTVEKTVVQGGVRLHTSKRMHFIEEQRGHTHRTGRRPCIRQNVCTSLRIRHGRGQHVESNPCIRQNVCTSLRRPAQARPHPPDEHRLHTSKRMHFIEEAMQSQFGCLSKGLHTSKRMHFIEEWWPCLG